MPKVVLVDDHVLLRNALAKIIHHFEGYSVLFEANNGRHFIQMLDPDNLPNIVILDVTMPVMNGYETSQWINANHPDMKVIALSMLNDERVVIRMLRSGAKGYLLKDTEVDELKKAMEEVLNKGLYINEILYKNIVQTINTSPEEKEELQHQVAMGLNDREREFLRWLCTDKSYKEIASEMFLSPRTVDGYRDSLFEKLKVASRIGLVMFAVRHEIAHL
ncbi:MAG: DNA-binding response regulator [Sediminibacterium sp.]|nr:DNA-binding response regulator [Sediminibacterium sp.]